ncbi:MAG: CBS domain-containing protein [Lunatimonas sp.]|uniref:CBS domain-containing protein n=1 Tax=Lunatimonas sp. TaxID=2060141 RepID=UPI00263A6355|nr:CBS domain-containing protein [Lunatimonas sp.]MCC5937271.1 CBS domain-containing protein [Lunatimonas sp.]
METRKYIPAKDVMDSKIVKVDGMATAAEAVALLKKEGVDALIVEKRNQYDAYGIVVTQDLLEAVVVAGKDPQSVNVFEIMSKPVVTVSSTLDVKYVAKLMVDLRIKQVPVEEDGEYLGMISIRSLVLNSGLFTS